jgi:hypothetical protein
MYVCISWNMGGVRGCCRINKILRRWEETMSGSAMLFNLVVFVVCMELELIRRSGEGSSTGYKRKKRALCHFTFHSSNYALQA